MKNSKTILLLLCYYIRLTEVNSKKTHGQFLLVIKTWMTLSRNLYNCDSGIFKNGIFNAFF